ncbi:hypothetical protein HIM_07223 [Hirsutella minnesotensis 3608]|uniref:Uncharacterized protein n=1 Tax=Hirsutella minnesotensis 3608 TaxID=1043627 RepID=A0A0F8A4E3_9HYPO|nr:hypothetical protein HIM_07223 [Hirsutella minnesotensis 3608]
MPLALELPSRPRAALEASTRSPTDSSDTSIHDPLNSRLVEQESRDGKWQRRLLVQPAACPRLPTPRPPARRKRLLCNACHPTATASWHHVRQSQWAQVETLPPLSALPRKSASDPSHHPVALCSPWTTLVLVPLASWQTRQAAAPLRAKSRRALRQGSRGHTGFLYRPGPSRRPSRKRRATISKRSSQSLNLKIARTANQGVAHALIPPLDPVTLPQRRGGCQSAHHAISIRRAFRAH